MLNFLLLTMALPLGFESTKSPKLEQSTLVFENHGVILKPQGLIALNSNEQHISIFQKLKLPQIKPIPNCATWFGTNWIGETNSLIERSTRDHINMFQHIANPVSLQKRDKRSIVAAIGVTLGLGVIDFLLTGISYKTLESHVSRVEQKLDEFVTSQHQFNEKILQVDENIVHIVDSLKSDINSQFQKIDCKFLVATGRLFANQLIFQWDSKLKSLFNTAISGRISTPLTPDALTPTDLIKIIADHSSLKSTYFSKNAYNLYKVGQLTLVGAYYNNSDNTVTTHQILTVPMVNPSSLLPYFKIEQTGIIKNNLCLFLDLPEYMYKYNNEFYPLDKNCKPGNSIITCFLPVLRESMHNTCLNSFTHCQPFQTVCKTIYSYDSSGILITTNETITAYQYQLNRKAIIIIQKTSVQTKFLSWHNTEYVQIGKLFVEKPSLTATHLKQNFTKANLNDWNNILDLTSEKLNEHNTSNILEQIELLKQPNPVTKSNTLLIYVLLFSLVALLVGPIVTIFCKKFYDRYKQKRKLQQTGPKRADSVSPQLYTDQEAANIIIHPQSQ